MKNRNLFKFLSIILCVGQVSSSSITDDSLTESNRNRASLHTSVTHNNVIEVITPQSPSAFMSNPTPLSPTSIPLMDLDPQEFDKKYFHTIDSVWLIGVGWFDLLAQVARYSSVVFSILSLTDILPHEQRLACKIVATVSSFFVPLFNGLSNFGSKIIKEQENKYHVLNATGSQEDLTIEQKELLRSAHATKKGIYFKGAYEAWNLSTGWLKLVDVFLLLATPTLNVLSLVNFVDDNVRPNLGLASTLTALGSILLEDFISKIPASKQRQFDRLKLIKSQQDELSGQQNQRI